MNIPKYIRTIGCYTQAFYSSMSVEFSNAIGPDIFEACTTVPFGINHVENNPNGIIDCIYDTDLGLKRACSILNIGLEHIYFGINDFSRALNELSDLLKYGSVILGPLDMGLLPYLPNGRQFLNIDHYIVVLGRDDDGFLIIIDPERVGVVRVLPESIEKSWRAENIMNIAGHYQIFKAIDVGYRPVNYRETFRKTVEYIIKNFDDFESKALSILYSLSKTVLDRYKSPSLWSGLTACLNSRVRRLLCGINFVSLEGSNINYNIKNLMEDEIDICLELATCMRGADRISLVNIQKILEKETGIGKLFRRIK